MESVIEPAEETGLRGGLSVSIGGRQVDESVWTFRGADAFGHDDMDAVAFALRTVGVR